MKNLKAQNLQLQRAIEGCMGEIEKQKQLNAQHESEIETLLTFNQRLLGIIENQLGNNRDNVSLNPISERSERDSDMLAQSTVNSLIRSRRLAGKSQWGFPTTQSYINQGNGLEKQGNKFDERSETESMQNDYAFTKNIEKRTTMKDLKRKMSEDTDVKEEMHQNIKQLQEFKNSSTRFYDEKAKEIRKLSDKLGNYHPLDQVSKIALKNVISSKTADLIKQRVMKNKV